MYESQEMHSALRSAVTKKPRLSRPVLSIYTDCVLQVPSVECREQHYATSRCCIDILPFHATKAYLGSGGRPPLILNAGTRWNDSLRAPIALAPEKKPPYPLNRRLGGPLSQSRNSNPGQSSP